MKKIILALALMLSAYVSQAVCPMTPPDDVCIRYDAPTGKLTLKATFSSYTKCSYANFFAPPYTTWAYIKDPSGPGYLGAFEVTSHTTDPISGDEYLYYDISIPGYSQSTCYDVYFISNRTWFYAATTGGWSFTPWGGLDPTTATYNTWQAPNGYYYSIYSTQIPITACTCPGSDPLPSCLSDFTLNLRFNTTPSLLAPGGFSSIGMWNYGSVSLIESHILSTYIYEWDGIAGKAGQVLTFAPGMHTVCVTEIMPDGSSCKTCMDFCIPATYSVAEPGGGTPEPSSMMKGTAANQTLNKLGDVELYPNPAKDNVDVKFSVNDTKPVEIAIIDMAGKTVKTIPVQNFGKGNHVLNVSTEGLNSGIYQVNIMVGNELSTQKLSIVK